MGRMIENGFGGGLYECQFLWPENCFVQCGSHGIVVSSLEEMMKNPLIALTDALQSGGSYRTAFFEAFPRQPKTFIRGEGETIAQAETTVWKKYQSYLVCEHPSFEKRGYTNGAGFCTQCGMFSSKHFAPWDQCPYCGYPVYPGSVCRHCGLFMESRWDIDHDTGMGVFQDRCREVARWLIQQEIYCPDCGTHIKDMRFVGSSEFRVTDEEQERQDQLYNMFMRDAVRKLGIFHPPTRLVFPASIFFECKCDRLKLITDLVGFKETHYE